MRNINVTKAAKRNAKSEAATTVSFAEIGAALIAAAKPATATPEAAKPSDLPTRQRLHLRALSRIFYAGETQSVHTDKKAKPLSDYVGNCVNGTGHQQIGLNDRTAALAVIIHTAHGNNPYNPSALAADISKHTSLYLNKHIALTPDRSGFTLTASGTKYALERIAGKAVSVKALGDYPTE